MKKLLAIILMAAVLFTGCGKQPEMLKVYEFNGLKWGSSVAECLSILGVTEAEVTIKEDSRELPYYKVRGLAYDTKIYGKDARLELVFIDDCVDTGISLGLTRVQYSFNEPFTGKEWLSAINKDILAQGLPTEEPEVPETQILQIASEEKSLWDIQDKTLKKKAVETWKKAFPKVAEDDYFSEESILKSQGLVSISRTPTTEQEENYPSSPALVVIDGTNAAVVQSAINS